MLTRRGLLQGSGALATAAELAGFAGASIKPTLPDKANFRVQEFQTCLNAGRWHPLSNGARRAAERYQEYKQRGIWDRSNLWSVSNPNMHGGSQHEARQLFATLINASPQRYGCPHRQTTQLANRQPGLAPCHR